MSANNYISKKVFICSDHGGFELKENIYNFLSKKRYYIKNLGPQKLETVDYPDFANLLANEILKNKGSFGILFCGTGIGISIAANRFSHIRAALCTDEKMASLSRKHNDANVLVMGGRTTKLGLAKNMTLVFLETGFEYGRHELRVNKL